MIMLLFTTVTTWAETIDGVKYIDENGVERTANGVTVLTGGAATTLTAGWYVCNSENLNYTGRLYLDGEVHLILADGCHMNIGSSSARISADDGIRGGNTLTIYSQSLGNDMGALGIYTNKQEAIDVSALTINGGNITADVIGTHVLFANDGAITINGGNITARTDGENSIALLSISNYGGNIIINGGSVTATANTNANGTGINASTITIGWKNTTDFIKASSYKGTLQTVDGKSFVAYDGENTTAFVSGTVDDVTILAGKTLKPLDSHVVSIGSEGFSFDKDADFVIGDTRYYKYAANANVTLSYTGYGFVQVTSATLNAVENQPMQRSFTMPATDVALTATAVTGLTATAVTYDGTARTPEIKQGDDVFDAANYAIDYKLGDEAVTAADVKNAGTYTCTLTGVGQYIGTVSDIDFTINKKQTTIAVVVDNANTIVAGDDARITVTMTPKIDTWTQLNIGEKSYSVAVVNGEGHFVFTNLFENTYSVTASFLENDNYVASTSDPNYSIAVSKVKTAIKISFDETDVTSKTKVVTVGEPVTVYVDLYTVPSDWDGDFAKASPFNSDAIVTVTARLSWKTDYNDHYTLGLVDGHGSITFSHLPADECHYNIFAAYAGDDNYQNYLTTDDIGGTLKLTVNKTATTIGVSVTSPVIAK